MDIDNDNDDHDGDGEYNKLVSEAQTKLIDLHEWEKDIDQRLTNSHDILTKEQLDQLKNQKQKILDSIGLLEKTIKMPGTNV